MNCNELKMEYSKIPVHELNATNAVNGMFYLLKNNFVEISAYYEIEAQKMIKALKVLGIQHNIKFIEAFNQNSNGMYEFSLKNFVDNRKRAD
jgi:hypothetical protein